MGTIGNKNRDPTWQFMEIKTWADLTELQSKEGIARNTNSVPEIVLVEEKEAAMQWWGNVENKIWKKGMLEYKWRELTGENGAGHLEVIFELLLHISPTRPILYF